MNDKKNSDPFIESKRTNSFAAQRTEFLKKAKLFLKDWRLYVLVIPMIVWFIVFAYKPMAGLLIAFKHFEPTKGIMGSDFVGLRHFQTLLGDVEFWGAFRNTFLISIYGLIFGFPVPILLALFFSEIGNGMVRKTAQTFSYLPHFLSEVTITGLIITMLAYDANSTGILARFLYSVGIPQGVQVMRQAQYFRPLYILTGLWKESGYNSIVYFAAIMSIPPTLYEAIKVDGGNKLQEIRYVTFPGMAPTLTIMIIMRIGRMLSVGYERVLLMTKPFNNVTYETAQVISIYVYNKGLIGNARDMAGAADLFNSLLGFTLVVGANFVSRKITETSLW